MDPDLGVLGSGAGVSAEWAWALRVCGLPDYGPGFSSRVPEMLDLAAWGRL